MAGPDDASSYTLRPPGTVSDAVQVTRSEIYIPKTAEELIEITRNHGEVINRRIATIFGLGILSAVTLAAIATFLGMTLSQAPSMHEDAVRLLVLIVGAVLGALYGAATTKGGK